ncbi:MAG TPA: signal peptidase I [Pseudolabrys sp.]|nr:signal peptidase I [Pseudolabrys sp.]
MLRKKDSGRIGWIRTIADVVVIACIVIAAKTAIAEPFYVPSASMEPTLLIGDELLATKYPYGYSTASLPSFLFVLPDSSRVLASLPKRGDVVVFRWPGDRSQVWVKRVIGLPGDHISISRGQVSVNGMAASLHTAGTDEMQAEDGTMLPAMRYIETLPGGHSHPILKLVQHGEYDDIPDIVVPPGHLFVLGDNRDNSADSRVPLRQGGVGMLPISDLVGRVDAVVGSWDLTMRNRPLRDWPSGLRLGRFFTSVH